MAYWGVGGKQGVSKMLEVCREQHPAALELTISTHSLGSADPHGGWVL